MLNFEIDVNDIELYHRLYSVRRTVPNIKTLFCFYKLSSLCQILVQRALCEYVDIGSITALGIRFLNAIKKDLHMTSLSKAISKVIEPNIDSLIIMHKYGMHRAKSMKEKRSDFKKFGYLRIDEK